MTAREVMTTQQALLAAALHLVDEHPDLPAGSVLRCFSRAVAITRKTGVHHHMLVERSASLARQTLAARNRPGSPGVPIPRPDRGPSRGLEAGRSEGPSGTPAGDPWVG